MIPGTRSVRKPFEAVLVALGTLRGELSLDDPVSRYVPELRGDYIKSVTIGEQAACRRPEGRQTTRQL
jgi:beta-lactamase class C